MTKHELTTPRYECIQPYPINEASTAPAFEVGSVLLRIPFATNDYYSVDGNQFNRLVPKHVIEAYPHLFRAMHWSEGRAVEDMPEYVNAFGNIIKIEKWATMHGVIIGKKAQRNLEYLAAKNCLPATQTEYEAYQNNKAI